MMISFIVRKALVDSHSFPLSFFLNKQHLGGMVVLTIAPTLVCILHGLFDIKIEYSHFTISHPIPPQSLI